MSDTGERTGNITFNQNFVLDNRTFEWSPQPDITPYEMALCMSVFAAAMSRSPVGCAYDSMPDEAKRHWKLDNTPQP